MSLFIILLGILAVMYDGETAGIIAIILGLAGLFYLLHPGRILLILKRGGP